MFTSCNYHVTPYCNYRCGFCFSQNLPEEEVPLEKKLSICEELRRRGLQKINFAGGEPFMCKDLPELIRYCKGLGFVTSVVSNGSLITREILQGLSGYLDWLGLSIDSVNESTEVLLGRHCGSVDHLENIIRVSQWAKEAGIKVKLNITVTRFCLDEDFTDLIRRIGPCRLKFFRALPIENMNGATFDRYSITDEQFRGFREFHSEIVLENGESPVFEDNDDMTSSYLMIDPIGRIMENSGGVLKFLDFEENIDRTDRFLSIDRYRNRGGEYRWN